MSWILFLKDFDYRFRHFLRVVEQHLVACILNIMNSNVFVLLC